jgi:predicted acyltransferase (DUF342 family)
MTMDENNLSVNLDVQIDKTLSVGDTVWFASNLSVAGPVDIQGSLSIEGTLDVHAPVQFQNSLSVESHVHFSTTLSLKGNAVFESSLSIKKNATIHENLSVGGTLDVVGITELKNNLSVVGFTVLESTLSVGDETTIADTLFLQSNLSVEAHADFKDFVQMGSTLSVTSDVIFSSNLSVSKSVTFADTLSVAQSVVFKDTLSVGLSTTLNNNLSVKGITVLSNTLSVKGATVLTNTLSVGNDLTIEANKSLTVDNITTNGDDLVITLGSDSTGKLRINGDLEVLGTLNQINTTIESIQVTDKTITLAVGQPVEKFDENGNDILGGNDLAGSNQYVHIDSYETNHKSGLKVEGIPYGVIDGLNDENYNGTFSSSELIKTENVYEKSLLWNMSHSGINGIEGMQFMGGINTFSSSEATNLEQIKRESFWEVKGGSLRITSLFKNNAGLIDKVSYGFRISRNRQLQIVKHEWIAEESGSNVVIRNGAPTINILQTLGVSFSS